MFNEKDKVKVDLSLMSSILNHAGYEGFLNYLSIITYKRINNSDYVDFSKFKEYSFVQEENIWIEAMEKLVEMGLAIRNGSNYTTTTKKKNWHKFVNDHQSFCRKFNGFLHFDMTELYRLKNDIDLHDIMYLGIRDRVIGPKSISRKFIKELTACSIYKQKQIEEKHDGKYLDLEDHYLPVSDSELLNNKLGEIPAFNGKFSPHFMTCVKKKKGNCKVVQLGNKLRIKNIRVCSFERNKQKFNKPKSNLDSLNKPSSEVGDVQDWESFSMVIDTSGASKSNKFRGILSLKDKRYMSWKDFKNYDIHKVNVLNEDGSMEDLRSILNR